MVDEDGEYYGDLFEDVRSYEAFKQLHIGLLSELPRKTIPAIARAVGEPDGQALHHVVQGGQWSVTALRERRGWGSSSKRWGERSIPLWVGESGDRKKGSTTDYVARQSIGNVGQIDNGMVSVNAYGVLDHVPCRLLCQGFKAEKRLKAEERDPTNAQLAVDGHRADIKALLNYIPD